MFSVTACDLDLGDYLVPRSVEGGHLLHLLSDLQWVLHWLLYVDSGGNEAVLIAGEPIGFRLDEDCEDPPPATIPMDGSFDLEVAADSFSEFMYRFWIENELWLVLENGGPLDPASRRTRRTWLGQSSHDCLLGTRVSNAGELAFTDTGIPCQSGSFSDGCVSVDVCPSGTHRLGTGLAGCLLSGRGEMVSEPERW